MNSRLAIVEYGNKILCAFVWDKVWNEENILNWASENFDIKRINLSLYNKQPIDFVQGPE